MLFHKKQLFSSVVSAVELKYDGHYYRVSNTCCLVDVEHVATTEKLLRQKPIRR